MTQFYTYVHARPNATDAHGIFYVGKGQGRRMFNLESRNNPHHTNIVKKYGAENILVGKLDCSSEQVAFELEMGIIKCLKRMGVRLANRTSGGEGPTGLQHSDETKALLSVKIRKIYAETDVKERISAKLKGNQHLLGHVHSEESKKRISEGILKFGFRHTEEHKQKLRVRMLTNHPRKGLPGTMLGKHLSESAKTKLSKINTGKTLSAEIRQKISAGGKGRVVSAETKAALTNSVWMTDGVKVKRIQKELVESFLSQGWKRGRR